MTSVDCLPTEILVNIFSYLPTYELLRVEKTCLRFKQMIEEHIWSCLKSITRQTIGCHRDLVVDHACIYPCDCYLMYAQKENFFRNFIEIAHRVREVRDFYTGLGKGFSGPGYRQASGLELHQTLWTLLEKRSSDSVFSSELVIDLLTLDDFIHMRWTDRPRTPRQVHSMIARLLKKMDLSRFGSLKVDRLFILNTEVNSDYLSIRYREQRHPLPLDLSRISRLRIDVLDIRLSPPSARAIASTRTLLEWVRRFSHLEMVEIDRMYLFLDSKYGYDDPAIEMTFCFWPHRYHMSGSEFASFLESMLESDDSRIEGMAKLINRCKGTGWLRHGEVSSYSNAFEHVKDFLSILWHADDAGESDESDWSGMSAVASDRSSCPDPTPITTLLDLVCPSMTDKIYLGVPYSHRDEEDFVSFMLERAATSRLKELKIFFTGEADETVERFINGATFEGTFRLRRLFSEFAKDLAFFKRLAVSFSDNRKFDLDAKFDHVMGPSGPVPHLREICYCGPPTFKSTIDIIKNAPNLQDLIYNSDWLEDEGAALECVRHLLVALAECSRLTLLRIHIHSYEVYDQWLSDRGLVRKVITEDDKVRHQQLLAGVHQQVQHLVASRPLLVTCEVTIQSMQYKFEVDKKTKKK